MKATHLAAMTTEAERAAVLRRIERAMWEGDIDLLCELAPCRCCCGEHTFGDCEARLWGGCRGGNGPTPSEETRAWLAHYKQFHGMTEDQFFGFEEVG